MRALYLAPADDWTIARTVAAYAELRRAALDRRPDGTYRLADDDRVYRVAKFWSQKALTSVWGVYREKEEA